MNFVFGSVYDVFMSHLFDVSTQKTWFVLKRFWYVSLHLSYGVCRGNGFLHAVEERMSVSAFAYSLACLLGPHHRHTYFVPFHVWCESNDSCVSHSDSTVTCFCVGRHTLAVATIYLSQEKIFRNLVFIIPTTRYISTHIEHIYSEYVCADVYILITILYCIRCGISFFLSHSFLIHFGLCLLILRQHCLCHLTIHTVCTRKIQLVQLIKRRHILIQYSPSSRMSLELWCLSMRNRFELSSALLEIHFGAKVQDSMIIG